MSEQLEKLALSRRGFLKTASATGLIIGFYMQPTGRMALAAEAPKLQIKPNAFIKIASDGGVTLIINKSEMGQGVYTSMAQLLAEELDCDWSRVKVEAAPVNPVYNHTFFPMQMTGGSTALASSYDQHRQIGATARQMLVNAAAKEWKIDAKGCTTDQGYVVHKATNKKISYGELVAKAEAEPMPTKVTLKDPKTFKIIGKPLHRLDAPDKVNGKAIFGMDVRVPGMLYVVVARSPVFGGKVKSFNADKAKLIKGVTEAVEVPTGIAIVATDTWAAQKGRDALEVEWDLGEHKDLSSEGLLKDYMEMANKPGAAARKSPEAVATVAQNGPMKVEASYDFPYLAHATMEPLNVTIDFNGEKCDIWTGTHMQTMDAMATAKILGISPEKVSLTTTFLGGSFGRRANPNSDFVSEAAMIAKAVKKPIKVVWTREDDMRGGYYRPMFHHKVTATLDANKKPDAWVQTSVGQSIAAGTPFESFMVKDGIDSASVEGISDTPYAIPHMSIDLHSPRPGVPVQWWRSVGHTHTAFVMETMIDELATLAKKDAVAFRMDLLKKHPRHMAALKLAAQKAGWGKKPAKGRAYGVAVHESFNTVVAHVVEISVVNNLPKVHKVVSAVHCGRVVNPSGATAQVEGAIGFGLTALLYGKITLKDGQVEQKNFDTYQILKLAEMPVVEVHFVPSTDNPTGLGEPGVPPLGPAIANAMYALTGKRVRKLPFT